MRPNLPGVQPARYLTGCALVLLYRSVTHQLLAVACVLSFAQPGEILGPDHALQAVCLRQLAVPLTLYGVALLPVVLFGRSEFLLVVGLRLAGAERFRDREHRRSLSPDM